MLNPLLARPGADAPGALASPEPARATEGQAPACHPAEAGPVAEGLPAPSARGPLTANQRAFVAACKASPVLDRAARLCKAHGLEFVYFHEGES